MVKHKKVGIGISCGLLLFSVSLRAQLSLPLDQFVTGKVESAALQANPDFFTCLKPFNQQGISSWLNVDSVLSFDSRRRTSWIGRKLWKESFLQLDSPSFHLAFDPLVNFYIGEDRSPSRSLFINTRGARVRGLLGKNIGFETSFYENQGVFAPYWDAFIDQTKVSPGQGRAKRFHGSGWDYAFSGGYIQWQVSRVLNVQFGHDKNFIGDGYRSLLLSDVSTNYPFLRFTFTWKKVQYTRIVASFMNLDYKLLGMDTKAFPKKTANFHLLSFSLPRRIQLSFFEGTILGNPDTQGRFKVNMDLVSPIPYMDLLKADKPHVHPITGINVRWQALKHLAFYNQWVFDEMKWMRSVNYGFQVGVKYDHAFTVQGLFLQAEYSQVMPYTYAHTDSVISYSHYSQPLGHPIGANFKEAVGIGRYQIRHWVVCGKMTMARYGEDNNSTMWGKNILRPVPAQVPGDRLLQGAATRLNTYEGFLSYYLNPKNQMNFSAGFSIQNSSATVYPGTTIFYLSFRTSLANLYYDFR